MSPVLLRATTETGIKVCNSKCYEAKSDICTCICNGLNHKKGLEQAKLNILEKKDELINKGITIPGPKEAKVPTPRGNVTVDKETGKVYKSLYAMGLELGSTLIEGGDPEKNKYIAFQIMKKYPDRFVQMKNLDKASEKFISESVTENVTEKPSDDQTEDAPTESAVTSSLEQPAPLAQ